MPVRAIRGAVQVDADEREAILEGTADLVSDVMTRNDLVPEDVISVLFTVTPDLTAEFPALAARKIGFHDVPLLCATEIPVPAALPRVVRLMMHVVNQPYLTEVNGYQTVCPGCFTPFPYAQSTDPRFAAVTQFSTGANSHYNGLQITAMKRLGHGLMGQLNYTWSRCMDTVSNGGFLQFSAGGILSPLPGDLARDYGPCDYDIRQNLNAQYVYQLPVKVGNRALGYALNGWQVSGTAFWHSGIPFSVLSTPYSANGNGIVNGSGPQFASVVPGVPLYDHRAIPGVTQPGTVQWLNPNAFVSTVDPSTGACLGGDSPKNCQFGSLGRNALRGPDFAWSDFYLTKWFPLTERVKLRFDTQFFNVFNHPNFGLPSMIFAGIPGKPSTQTGFGALTYTTSPPTGLLGVGLGGDSTPRMIAFQLRLEF